jgi:hypothetical protein
MPTERLEGSITHGRLMFSQTQRIGAFPLGTCCSSLCTSSIVEVRANAGPIFVRLSNNGRLAVVVRVAAVFLILFILVIVGVPWRHRGAEEAQSR